MSVRAEWRLQELLGQPRDPFESVVLSTGLSVDLTGDEDEIHEGIARTVAIESRLFNKGVTCELKDGGQNCLDCPMYVADRLEEERAPLCRLGRDQRILLDRLDAIGDERHADLAEGFDLFAELAALAPENEELLTAAGL